MSNESAQAQARMRAWIRTSVVFLFVAVALFGVFAAQKLSATDAVATTQATVQAATPVSAGTGWALIGSGLAIGISIIGAGIAVGNVGAAAMGAIGENPKLFGTAIVFVGLAEGLAIFGFIMSFLILNKA